MGFERRTGRLRQNGSYRSTVNNWNPNGIQSLSPWAGPIPRGPTHGRRTQNSTTLKELTTCRRAGVFSNLASRRVPVAEFAHCSGYLYIVPE